MKRAYGYIRVSTVGQAEEGFSLDHQRQAIKDYCKTRGLHLAQVYVDEGKSGRTANRPEFQSMLKAIKDKGIDSVLIYKIDRFARNVTDFSRIWNEFKANNINLISVLEGDLSNGSSLVPNIFASVAQWESEVNGQRTRDALMEKFHTGWQPTPPPPGYRTVGGERERKSCEPDPYEGPIIKKMFEMYSTGQYSMLTLQEWLKDKNIISKNGTIISFSKINNILNNPFYYGLIRWHGVEKMGKQIPLISKSLFTTCQYVLEKKRHFLVRERKYDFLLRGFAYCSCGMRLVGDQHTVRSNKRIVQYYHCQKRYSPDCKEKYVRMIDLERYVEEFLMRVGFTPDFIEEIQEQAKSFVNSGRKDNQGARQAIINMKSALETKRNKLEDLLIDGCIEKETYKRKHAEISESLENLQVQLDEVVVEGDLDMPLIEETLSLVRNIYETYKNAPQPLKRHYLRYLFERFVIKDKRVVEVVPTPIFKMLLHANSVRLSKLELRGEDSNLQPYPYSLPPLS
jgi:site-specific DNA recombinase